MTENANTTCQVQGCERPVFTSGYCSAHYQRVRTYGDPRVDVPVRSKSPDKAQRSRTQGGSSGECRIDDCPKGAVAKGMCSTHYQRQHLRGDLRETDPIGYRERKEQCICSVVGCVRIAVALGMCYAHWERQHRTGDVRADEPFRTYADPGNGTIDAYGYRRLRINGRRVPEHRLVVEELIGRPLLPTEEVHHVNGDRADNRPQNLELWDHSQPSGQRVQDKLAWAFEIISRYGDPDDVAVIHNREVGAVQ